MTKIRPFLNKKKYSHYKSWHDRMVDGKVNIKIFPYHPSWNPMFEKLFEDTRIENIENKLTNDLLASENVLMHPAPDLLYNSFRYTSLKKLKVVFIGQDPYFNNEKYKDRRVHQAMGLSFSVPYDFKIPSSLDNIYRNLDKFGHLLYYPKHGNLEFWTCQGCLMLNTSLTVLNGDQNKNCHKNIWKWFTDQIIRYISDNCEHVVFVLWGANALEKQKLINFNKHEAIISSHPSGLSSNKNLGYYPAFDSLDHFGEINKKLRKWNMKEIIWQL